MSLMITFAILIVAMLSIHKKID
ncbi:hypothetical protein [Chengkuizengella marina]